MQLNQFKDQIDQLLQQGMLDLSMTLGVLARIENDNYEIIAVQSNSGAYVPGEKYVLGETYCREVFDKQQVIATTKIDNSPLSLLHPLYRSLPLECYLGAPIVIDGESWGCIDFSSIAQRDEKFGDRELGQINSLAQEISRLLGNAVAARPH